MIDKIENLGKVREIAFVIYKDYSEKRGVFKEFQFPPEYNLPREMKKSSEEHLLFVTLTVSLDYMRDAVKLWKQSYDVWMDKNKRWTFDPKLVVQNGLEELTSLFKEINDQRPIKDAKIWFTISKKLLESGGVYNLLKTLNFDTLQISDYIDKYKKDFPYLRGYKIKPLWLRMINDTAGIKLKRIEEVPLPIDIHTARMTLRIVFNQDFDGKINKELREKTQNAWKNILDGSLIYPLQIDEPLWLMGKYKLLDKFAKQHNYKF